MIIAAIEQTYSGSVMPEQMEAVRSDGQSIDQFLQSVERRALRMAEFATGNREEALDLVQDAMFGFVRHYAAKPQPDWKPLFYRVLDSRLNDWHRRQKVRNRWIGFFSKDPDEGVEDAIAQTPDVAEPGPLLRLAAENTALILNSAIAALPLRQRQAFLLRLWEGLDVAETATSMGCSQGSVKTHLSRALTQLRRSLENDV